ncbi:hypothetical protein D3C87_1584440 [compost metagenome]
MVFSTEFMFSNEVSEACAMPAILPAKKTVKIELKRLIDILFMKGPFRSKGLPNTYLSKRHSLMQETEIIQYLK